jgi:hypothetical protein
MRFYARPNKSRHEPPHLLRNAGLVTDSPTGNRNAMPKCLLVVYRSCTHEGFELSSQAKIQRIQIWRAWKPCTGCSSTCPSAMRGFIENIWYNTYKICLSIIIMHNVRDLTVVHFPVATLAWFLHARCPPSRFSGCDIRWNEPWNQRVTAGGGKAVSARATIQIVPHLRRLLVNPLFHR